MSHLHAWPAEHGTALPITVLNGAVDNVSWIPACAKSVLNWAISMSRAGVPLAYSRLNAAFAPLGTPAPHCPAPVPGFAQVLTLPAFTVQPLLCSIDTALAGLYGNGLFRSVASTKFEGGFVGTGPYVP